MALTPLNQMKFQMILSERFMKSTVISHQYYRIIMKSLVKSVKSCKCCKNFTGKSVKYTLFQVNMPTLLSSNANVWNFLLYNRETWRGEMPGFGDCMFLCSLSFPLKMIEKKYLITFIDTLFIFDLGGWCLQGSETLWH